MAAARAGTSPNGSGNAVERTRPFRIPAAIRGKIRRQGFKSFRCKGDEDMTKNIIRIATNEKLTRAAHWTVFSIGLLSLTFSIAATAASAL